MKSKLVFLSSGAQIIAKWFIYQSVDNVRKICDEVDLDLEKIKDYLVVEYKGTQIMVNIEMLPSWDGKLTRT